MRIIRPKTIEGLKAKLASMFIIDDNGCHIFTGIKSVKGYGKIRFKDVHYRAHRLSYELANGEIKDGRMVLHKCDVPACINPDHLFLGTAKDNALDRKRKGRGNNQYTKSKVA